MELLQKEQLKKLIEPAPPPCISIYIPTSRAGVEAKQGCIRLKNQLKRAEKELSAQGLRTPQIAELLEPAHKLTENNGFWRYQGDGLALFRSPDKFYYYRLPIPFEELLIIDDRFHVKPLMRVFAEDGRFYLLTLSKNDIHLYQCTRFGIREVELPADTPRSFTKVLEMEGIERQIQVHTAGKESKFHGHGARDEDEKENLREFFRRVDRGVKEVLHDDRAPLVLAGVEYLFPLYREASAHPNLLAEGVPGNPEGRRPEELQAEAWKIVEPYLLKARREAAKRFEELAGSPRASTDIKEVIPAAYQGRVEDLFVAAGRQIWGRFNPETQEVTVNQEQKAGDRDLLNLAAIHTFLHGGSVYAVEPADVPGGGLAAAVFRY
jgi:hypothetical protein